jgi:hypothetical protein
VITNSRGPESLTSVQGRSWNGQVVIDATNDWAADELAAGA